MDRAVCRHHAERTASWRCEGCGALLCEACVNTAMVGRVRMNACRSCHGHCVLLAAEAEEEARAAVPPPRFIERLPGAFLYPLRGNGLLLIVLGALFFWLVAVAGRMLFSIVLAIFAGGYLSAYLMRVVNATANGEDELPSWPGVADFFEDILVPFFLLLATLAATFGPAAVAAVIGFWKWRPLLVAVPLLLFVGFLCLPMSVLGVAVLESIEGLFPKRVFSAIAKVFANYLLVLAVLAALLVHRRLVGVLFSAVPYVGSLFDGIVSMYVLAVEMRLLGLLYRTQETRLNWFPREEAPPPRSPTAARPC